MVGAHGTVRDSRSVRVGERRGDLPSESDRAIRNHRPVIEYPGGGLPLEQLHDDVVDVIVLAPVVDLDDAGVLELRLELSFGPERLEERRIAALGAEQDLHGNGSAEFLVGRAPDLRSAFDIETVLELVAPRNR